MTAKTSTTYVGTIDVGIRIALFPDLALLHHSEIEADVGLVRRDELGRVLLCNGETLAVGVGSDKLGKREVVLLRKEIVGAGEGVQVVRLDGLEALRRALVNPAVDDHGQLSALLLRRSVEEDFTLPGSIAEVLAALVAKEERVAGAI